MYLYIFIIWNKVFGTVEEQAKSEKIIVFKYKPKKNYKRNYGILNLIYCSLSYI